MTKEQMKEEMDYTANCRRCAKKLLEEKGYRHIIYGVGNSFTDWENEMLKFEDDKTFDDYVRTLAEDENPTVYAVHA